MSFRMSFATIVVSLFSVFIQDTANAFPPTSKIDATQGRQYRLSKEHGPWMIMVASFRDVPEERRLAEGKGLSAREAADQLVYELRRNKLPAYTFSKDEVVDQVRTSDRRTGELRSRNFIAQQGQVVVLAGNYGNAESKTAQNTLKKVKTLKPKFLVQEENGGLFRITPGRPGPLSGAFMTVNPLLTPEEIQSRKRDPLIMHLNVDMEHSLLKNPGRYTLRIATFYGKAVTQVSTNRLTDLARKFDLRVGNSLDDAGADAWRLTAAMRDGLSLGYERDYEAYVFHDRYKSYVTIGSYDDPRDPRIPQVARMFAAKRKMDPSSGREILSAEVFSIPRNAKPGKALEYSWMFDPNPQIIEVPRLN